MAPWCWYQRGFLASLINRNWLEARQEIQARLYCGPCTHMSEGKQVKVSLALYLSWEWGVIWLFNWDKGRMCLGLGLRDGLGGLCTSLWQEVPEKHLLLLYWLCQSLWLCGSPQTGKFWKRWEYQTTWPASWEICMQVKNQHGTRDWFQIWEGIYQGCILSPCLFNLYAGYVMRNTGLDEAQLGVKIAGRNINDLRYADDTILMQKAKNWRASWKWKRRVKKLA